MKVLHWVASLCPLCQHALLNCFTWPWQHVYGLNILFYFCCSLTKNKNLLENLFYRCCLASCRWPGVYMILLLYFSKQSSHVFNHLWIKKKSSIHCVFWLISLWPWSSQPVNWQLVQLILTVTCNVKLTVGGKCVFMHIYTSTVIVTTDLIKLIKMSITVSPKKHLYPEYSVSGNQL